MKIMVVCGHGLGTSLALLRNSMELNQEVTI